MKLHPTVAAVTERIAGRSRESRARYLEKIERARGNGPHRRRLSCGNLAHGFAACGATLRANGPGVPAQRLFHHAHQNTTGVTRA